MLRPLNAVINPRALTFFRIAFFQFNKDVLIGVEGAEEGA